MTHTLPGLHTVLVVSNEKDYQSVLWESAGFMQVKVGA